MDLTPAQMRAIELNIEQMDRLLPLITVRVGVPVDIVVREFYRRNFEASILNKIAKLLTPDSQEDLTMTFRVKL